MGYKIYAFYINKLNVKWINNMKYELILKEMGDKNKVGSSFSSSPLPWVEKRKKGKKKKAWDTFGH